MSKKTKVDQLKTIYGQFKALDFNSFFSAPGNYSEWDGLNIEEFKAAVEYISKTYEEAFEKDVFDKLPFASINALVSSLNAATQHTTALFQNKAQPQFQNAASQVDNVMHQLMVYDIPSFLAGEYDIQEIKGAFEQESQKLAVNNAEVEGLKANVRSLIEPAVSGSLSKSFSDRRKSLYHGRILWGIAALIFAVVAICTTYSVSSDVIHSMRKQTQEKSQTESQTEEMTFSIIILRSVVLIPIYLGFGFAFSQYRKERDLEEEYAHKAAVATTLPNYGELAKGEEVRDQIVSGASNVIFESPIHKTKQKQAGSDLVDSIKGLLETAGKTIRREE